MISDINIAAALIIALIAVFSAWPMCKAWADKRCEQARLLREESTALSAACNPGA